jgi:hypothetical protein
MFSKRLFTEELMASFSRAMITAISSRFYDVSNPMILVEAVEKLQKIGKIPKLNH